MRIATLNTHAGRDESGVPALGRQAAALARVGADVVFLQEIDHRNERSRGIPQAHRLAHLAGYRHVAFGPAMTYRGGWYGNAILSAAPLRDPIVVPFTPTPSAASVHVDGRRRGWPEKMEPRSALCATADLRGVATTLVSAHLSVFPEERCRAVAQLQSVLPPGPVLCGVDSNAADPQSPERRALRDRLADLADGSAAARAPTFPAPEPRHTIDLPLARGWVASAVWTVASTASDHHAVVADVLPDASPAPRAGLRNSDTAPAAAGLLRCDAPPTHRGLRDGVAAATLPP